MNLSGDARQFAVQTRKAYERWAPLYPPEPHNPVMRAEQALMMRLWPHVKGQRVLDLACGSGRYAALLQQSGAAHVVAADFCVPMLKQVAAGDRVCASMMQLPFSRAAFAAVVSGLALGHATGLDAWMQQIARVLMPGGTLLYSDFHPQAARAGFTRSFKDRDSSSCTVPHQAYSVDDQLAAIGRAGLRVVDVREARVGSELREPFRGSETFYRDWHDLPIVLVVRAVQC